MASETRLTYDPDDITTGATSAEAMRLRAWLRDQCPTCAGYGRAEASSRSWVKCWTCHGTGRKRELTRYPLDFGS